MWNKKNSLIYISRKKLHYLYLLENAFRSKILKGTVSNLLLQSSTLATGKGMSNNKIKICKIAFKNIDHLQEHKS